MPRPYDTANYKRAKKALAGHPCARCGVPAYTVDHAIPVGSGEPRAVWDAPSNMRPMCGRCNSALGGHMNRGRRRGRRRRMVNRAY